MPALFDTSVAILLLRSRTPEFAVELVRVARAEVAAGTAVLAAPVLSELLMGERGSRGREDLRAGLETVATAILPIEAANDAGVMGGFLTERGAFVPLPDLLIAATAIWLDIPLLTWDGDYARARQVAVGSRSAHEGAVLWRKLQLHPASKDA